MTAEQKKAIRDVVSTTRKCFTGFRVPLKTLFDFLQAGDSIDDFLAVYPLIPREQVIAVLEQRRELIIDHLQCGSS
jgi:uncharacterized protein (DUF433 family)